MFSRFGKTPTCDRQMDRPTHGGRTHDHSTNRARIVSRSKTGTIRPLYADRNCSYFLARPEASRCRRQAYVLPTIVFKCLPDYCFNAVGEMITMAEHSVYFCQGTLPWQPILSRDTATSWHSPPSFFVLAFYNGCDNRQTYRLPIARLSMNPLHLVEICELYCNKSMRSC